MGVELNFIQKQKKEIPPKRIILSTLTLFLALSVGTLFFQWNHATNQQETADLLREQEQELAAAKTPDSLESLFGTAFGNPNAEASYRALDAIQSTSVPHIDVYNYVRDRLGGAQLRTFDFNDNSSAILNADFESLDALSTFATRLQELPSVVSVETGNAKQEQNGRYNASLTLMFDVNFLREDLNAK